MDWNGLRDLIHQTHDSNHKLHWFNNFVLCFLFVNYFLFNDIITKINTCKTDHQSNIRAFVWECNNLIKNKLKKYEDIQNQLNDKKKLKKRS